MTAHRWHALAIPPSIPGGTITPTGISSPLVMPHRTHARPSAWAQVSSRLVAEWQAIITVWLCTLAACTVLTVQPAYDAPGHLLSGRGCPRAADRLANKTCSAAEDDMPPPMLAVRQKAAEFQAAWFSRPTASGAETGWLRMAVTVADAAGRDRLGY